MNLTLSSGSPLQGSVSLAGDKSLSHRAALFAALAEGESCIDNFLVSGVTRAMLGALTALGIQWNLNDSRLSVSGKGLRGFKNPAAAIHCGNSATTLRLLAGALAAGGVNAVLDGSDGLRRRPMGRIVEPLQRMGVSITAAEQGGCPLSLGARDSGARLKGIDYALPVASAQVKTCLILAALAADSPVSLSEPVLSRDHSERMLRSMGVDIQSRVGPDGRASLSLTPPESGLKPLRLALPADPSAAAFLIVAALITPGSELHLPGVLLNPTRTGLIEALKRMGAPIKINNRREQNDEPLGDLTIRAGVLSGTEVSGSQVVDMIDEFPAFAIAAAFARGRTVVSQAEELRYKESDRIGLLVQALKNMGVSAGETNDGFIINGSGVVPGGCSLSASGDHRLGMSFALAGLAAEAPVSVMGAEIINESFPNFAETLQRLGAGVSMD